MFEFGYFSSNNFVLFCMCSSNNPVIVPFTEWVPQSRFLNIFPSPLFFSFFNVTALRFWRWWLIAALDLWVLWDKLSGNLLWGIKPNLITTDAVHLPVSSKSKQQLQAGTARRNVEVSFRLRRNTFRGGSLIKCWEHKEENEQTWMIAKMKDKKLI